MTATNHVVTGALIATFVHNPWVALPLALASHFVLDAIPHLEYLEDRTDTHSIHFFSRLAADCALAASILLSIVLLQAPHAWLLAGCGALAASPDLMWLYYLVLQKGPAKEFRPAIVRLHAAVQKHTSVKLWPVELVWLLGAGSLLVSRLY